MYIFIYYFRIKPNIRNKADPQKKRVKNGKERDPRYGRTGKASALSADDKLVIVDAEISAEFEAGFVYRAAECEAEMPVKADIIIFVRIVTF